MKLTNKLYDVLKWLVMIVIPAAATLYAALGEVWGFPYIQEIGITATAVCTFLGAIIGISTAEYNKDK